MPQGGQGPQGKGRVLMHGAVALAIPLAAALLIASLADLATRLRTRLANMRSRRYGKTHDE